MHAGDRQSKCMPPYYRLLHSLDFVGVTSRLRLGSLPCIVCCMLRFAYAHGVPSCVSVMTPPRSLHLPIRFYFFFNRVCPQDSPPPEARPRTSTYMEGIQIRKWKGPLHAVLVHILWVQVSPKTAILILGM